MSNVSTPVAATGAVALSGPKTVYSWKARAVIRRILVTILVLGQTAIATWGMIRVLPYHGGDILEISLVAVFCLLFFGISVGFWFGFYGFVVRRSGGDPLSLLRRHPSHTLASVPLAKTAIIMPIYHEPVDRTFARMRAIYRSLASTGQLGHFDFFILSDSRDPEYWLAEQTAWYQLCKDLAADGRIFYRRRRINLKHKSGNVADFFRRWGRNYKYAIVLDADSIMAGETILRMVRLMELEPAVGILQSCPYLINAESLFARVQQFGNHLYGPIFSTGLAALQLGEATYWGHNAVIRTAPFMRHCGLRRLPGRGLFSGAIMSHDFVEAAYMAGAGYEVWLEPGLTGSYEECPPTLVEDLIRDRRWAKGNLQHLWLVFRAKNITMAHRMAFLNGVMSYVASPLWLVFLILSTVETTRLILWPINYFPEKYSPVPVWPEWHPELAIALVSSTVLLLYLPKLLALLDSICRRRLTKFGGLCSVFAGVVLEIVVSSLLAPIRMLAHSRFVMEALFNVNLQWAGQNRSGETSWQQTLISQLPGSLLAFCWAGFTFRLDLIFFLWSLPVVIPLLLAAPISIMLGKIKAGQLLANFGLLRIPEENEENLLLDDARHPGDRTYGRGRLSVLEEAIIDPVINKLHQELARRPQGRERLDELQLLRHRCLDEGVAVLTTRERNILAQDKESLQWLHQAVWRTDRNSCWSRLFDGLSDAK
jgi:membrane glycosyltransferase